MDSLRQRAPIIVQYYVFSFYKRALALLNAALTLSQGFDARFLYTVAVFHAQKA